MYMALNKPLLSEKVHYSGPSGGGGHGYGHVYSASGHSGYGYHEPGHGHSYHSKGKEKKSIALSALTLLAFLFFLHILQNCLEDQEQATNSTTVIVMARNQQPQSYGTDLRKRKGQSNRRKGEMATEEPDTVEELDEEYQESSEFLEKKSAAKSGIRRRHWDDKFSKGEKKEDSKVVKIKTFTKYDKIDFD